MRDNDTHDFETQQDIYIQARTVLLIQGMVLEARAMSSRPDRERSWHQAVDVSHQSYHVNNYAQYDYLFPSQSHPNREKRFE